MDIHVTPKSFNIWAYMLVVKRADLHQTGSCGDHVICQPNQDNFESEGEANNNYARTTGVKSDYSGQIGM